MCWCCDAFYVKKYAVYTAYGMDGMPIILVYENEWNFSIDCKSFLGMKLKFLGTDARKFGGVASFSLKL